MKNNFDPLVADNWYAQSRTKIMEVPVSVNFIIIIVMLTMQ